MLLTAAADGPAGTAVSVFAGEPNANGAPAVDDGAMLGEAVLEAIPADGRNKRRGVEEEAFEDLLTTKLVSESSCSRPPGTSTDQFPPCLRVDAKGRLTPAASSSSSPPNEILPLAAGAALSLALTRPAGVFLPRDRMTGTLPSSSSSPSKALVAVGGAEVESDDVDSFETSDDRGFVRFLMTKAGASS